MNWIPIDWIALAKYGETKVQIFAWIYIVWSVNDYRVKRKTPIEGFKFIKKHKGQIKGQQIDWQLYPDKHPIADMTKFGY